jgi:hypothetical protein
MSYLFWTLACLCVYIGGLVILVRVTPLLLIRRYDDAYFMAIAAADVLGGICVFGAVAVTFALFSGVFAVRLLDFFLLLGILIVTLIMSYRSYYSRRFRRVQAASRIMASVYCLLLGLAALLYIGLLFVPST